MKIINKVKGCKTIKWSDLKTYEFNDLKSQSRDVTKLKNSIVNDGFCFPFYIWAEHRYVIDGNGRNIVLAELEEQGYKICDLPYVEIEAETMQEAKKRVLQASSEHGKVTQDSFNAFTADMDLDSFKESVNFGDVELETEDFDYSVLDNNPAVDKELEQMAGDVKKAIMIEFNMEDYEEALDLVKQHRVKESYIGALLIEILKSSL